MVGQAYGFLQQISETVQDLVNRWGEWEGRVGGDWMFVRFGLRGIRGDGRISV